jgi:hypothetical protein
MKAILFTALAVIFFVVGCVERPTQITSPDESNNSFSFLKLSGSKTGGLGVETVYSTSKIINGAAGGSIQLNGFESRPGNQFGDFEVHINIDVPQNSFPSSEFRLFTVSLDDQYALLYITPSPHTLYQQLIIDFEVSGIDVSEVTPENLGFMFISDDNDAFPTETNNYFIHNENNSITIVDAVIANDTTILPGSRYGWVRKAE